MKFFIIIFLLIPHLRAENYFSSDAAGITSGDFLNLDINPRVIALGGAQTAVIDDASAIYSNPAGLIEIPKFSIMLSNASYVEDIKYQFISYAQRISYDSVISVSGFITDIGSIEHTDINQNIIGKFSPKDKVITVGYSKGITEFSDRETDVSMGIAYKYINSTIYHTAKATAFDMGIRVFKFTYIPYKLSFLMQNLGSGLRYDQESVPIPLKFKIGSAIYPFPSLMFATDIVLPKNDSYYLNLGTELNLKTGENASFALRGGINTQKAKNGTGGFSFGFGLNLKFLSIDYSFSSMKDLGNASNISLSFDFPIKEPVFERKEKSIYFHIPKEKAE
ncbi:MAG: PorV/PorQ family protein [Elusimicrobiales bacterium]|nr:PorV/PorQ family protein [Elusimicrobiales bacterium]